MGERQVEDGERWHKKLIEILNGIGWTQRGANGIDVYSPNTESNYGIDSYFTYYDPYEMRDIGIFVEAKSRQWGNFASAAIEGFLKRLIEIMTEVPSCEEFNEKLNNYVAEITNTGCIFVWVNDGKYIHDKYLEYLQKANFAKKRHLQRVFFFSNYDIIRICSIINLQHELIERSKKTQEPFKYYYPSLTRSKNDPDNLGHLTLEYLFSKYIFGKMTVEEETYNGSERVKILVIMYFDDINLESLKLMHNSLYGYQLLSGTDKVSIFYYNKMKNHNEVIEEFNRYLLTNNNSKVKFEHKQMNRANDDVYYWSDTND